LFIKLTGPQLGQIRKAIVDAYSGAGAQAIDELNLAITDYIEGRTVFQYVAVNIPFHLQVGELLARANAEGWLATLLGAVRQDRSDREDLQRLLRSLLSTVPAEQVLAFAAGRASFDELSRHELQQLLPGSALVMPAVMEQRMRAVCRVDYADLSPPAVGTGFLIGADLVLSNWHVLRRAIEGPDKARDLRFRFDVRTDSQAVDGAGRVARAAENGAAVLRWRPAGADEISGGAGEPSMQQLDYGLIRLSERVGDDPTPGSAAGRRRGYISVRRTMPQADVDSSLMVLQHPMRGPLQFAIGVSKGPSATGSRFRHTAATQKGSSGSPVLAPDLGLVGLHNGAGFGTVRAAGAFNTAVPIAHIIDDLSDAGITEILQE
jgi:hypothetical protein